MDQKKTKPRISPEAMEMLESHILKPSPPAPTKTHEALVWDECKRHILACIHQNFMVQ